MGGRFAQAIGALALTGVCACPRVPDEAPCTDDGRCLPGFVCREGRCVEAEGSAGGLGIGPGGGLVEGPDGVTLRVHAGTLPSATVLSIARVPDPLVEDGVTPASASYRVSPLLTRLDPPLTISIPVDGSRLAGRAETSSIAVYLVGADRARRLATRLARGRAEADLEDTSSPVAAGASFFSTPTRDGGAVDLDATEGDSAVDGSPDAGRPPFTADASVFGDTCDPSRSDCSSADAPLCFDDRIGGERYCTRVCGAQSDCQPPYCCHDASGIGDPSSFFCARGSACASTFPWIPVLGRCATDLDCTPAHFCHVGTCHLRGSFSGGAGAPCATPGDCDPRLTDDCVFVLSTGAYGSGSPAAYEGSVLRPGTCEPLCGAGAACASGCCRRATPPVGAPERARDLCVAPASCAPGDLGDACMTESSCDPRTAPICHVRADGTDAYCSRTCASDRPCPTPFCCKEFEGPSEPDASRCVVAGECSLLTGQNGDPCPLGTVSCDYVLQPMFCYADPQGRRAPFCSRACGVDSPCPDGFCCATVEPYPGANQTVATCVYNDVCP